MTLWVGSAVEDITPENGEDLCGFALRVGPTAGVGDRLKGRWICLRGAGAQTFCLGSADIISLTRSRFDGIRRGIQEGSAKGIEVMLATTHTHSGPATVPLRHCGVMSRDYMGKLEARLIAGAQRGMKGRGKKVGAYLGKSFVQWGVIRRGRHNGQMADQQVVTLTLRDGSTGKVAASIVSYACHPVVLGHGNILVSADYPGYLCALVEAETGAPCLFLNGACGDVNPINAHQEDLSEAVKAGEAIGGAALKAMEKAVSIDADRVFAVRQRVGIPVHLPQTKAELQLRFKMLKQQFALDRLMFEGRYQRDLRHLTEGTFPREVGIELSLLCMGSQFAILFVPGELFSSIGARMQAVAAAEGITLMISGFSNGSVGYLCDRDAYEDGGYEPYYANLFYDFPEFEPGVEDHLLAGFEKLLDKRRAELAAG